VSRKLLPELCVTAGAALVDGVRMRKSPTPPPSIDDPFG
jgi:hypothetical protein